MNSRRLRWPIAGSAIGLTIVVIAALLSGFAWMLLPPNVHFSVGGSIAILTSLGLLLVERRVAKSDLPFVVGAGTLIASTVVPIVFFASSAALNRPVVGVGFRCGTAEASLPILWGMMLIVGGLVGATISAMVVAIVRSRPRLVLFGASLATLSLAALFAFALVSLRHPDPDTYRATLQTQRIELGQTLLIGDTKFSYDHDGSPKETCAISVQRNGGRALTQMVEECPPLVIEHDGAVALRVVNQPSGNFDWPLYASLGNSLESRDVTTHDLRGHLGLPRAWIVAPGFGLGLALLLLGRAFAARRQLRSLDGIDAEHVGRGWVRADGMPPRFLPTLEHHVPGPVLLVAKSGEASYRHDGTSHVVSALGSREAVVRDLTTRIVGASVLAFVVVLVTSAALWAARLHDLL